MKASISRTLTLLAAAATLMVAVPLLAVPSGDGEGGEAGRGGGLRQVVRLHVELGQYYLLNGQYDLAQGHYLAVTDMELPTRPERPEGVEEGPQAREGAPEGAVEGRRGRRGQQEGRQGRQGRRGQIRQAIQVKAQAYLMAAVSTHLLGDEAGAVALAQEGQAFVDALRAEHGRERAEAAPEGTPERQSRFETFLEDPDAFSERFASGPEALETRILEIEAELGDNAPL